MATVNAFTLSRSPVAERSYDYSDQATITAAPATGDLWNFLVIPAGTEIRSITIQNADLGTAAPFDLGYTPLDGSTGDADAFLDDYAGGTAAAAGAAKTYLLATPVRVEKDSFLQALFGTIDTGASGAVTVAINGKLLGPK